MRDPASDSGDITTLLREAREGRPRAVDALVERVYPELRRIARGQLRGGIGSTMNTTSLVHEAFLKVPPSDRTFSDREHFFATLARAMRQVVVDHARARAAAKRGGGAIPVTLDESAVTVGTQAELVLDIDRVLGELAAVDERLVRIVECRFFAGLTEEETASALGLSRATVQRDWSKARARLRRRLQGGDPRSG
jgi:RNA polymerase sigma factor (TIGR02999 family)